MRALCQRQTRIQSRIFSALEKVGEKALDVAATFLEKVLGPAAEESGQVLADRNSKVQRTTQSTSERACNWRSLKPRRQWNTASHGARSNSISNS